MKYLQKLNSHVSIGVIVGIILYVTIAIFILTIPDSVTATPTNQELMLKQQEVRALERIATSLEKIERKIKM